MLSVNTVINNATKVQILYFCGYYICQRAPKILTITCWQTFLAYINYTPHLIKIAISNLQNRLLPFISIASLAHVSRSSNPFCQILHIEDYIVVLFVKIPPQMY